MSTATDFASWPKSTYQFGMIEEEHPALEADEASAIDQRIVDERPPETMPPEHALAVAEALKQVAEGRFASKDQLDAVLRRLRV